LNVRNELVHLEWADNRSTDDVTDPLRSETKRLRSSDDSPTVEPVTVDVRVRLDGPLAAFVDQQVTAGRAKSHEEAVERLLEAERRNEQALDEYLNDEGDDDLPGLARWATDRTLDVD
jgi:hypothetical protein